MGKTKVTGLNLDVLRKDLTQQLVKAQTDLLVSYAAGKIVEIGATISSYHSRHHMDRTGNLLDSLCWGVSYDGQLQQSGFYREAMATMPSGLHEWWNVQTRYYGPFDHYTLPSQYEVNGRQLAQQFIEKQGNTSYKGWLLFFAILAPYWGYWEEGFTLVNGLSRKGNFQGAARRRFAVMTQMYDTVKNDLRPAKTTFKTKAVPFTNTGLFRSARRNSMGSHWKNHQK